MAFDPDAYLAGPVSAPPAAPSFDPDAYLAKPPASMPPAAAPDAVPAAPAAAPLAPAGTPPVAAQPAMAMTSFGPVPIAGPAPAEAESTPVGELAKGAARGTYGILGMFNRAAKAATDLGVPLFHGDLSPVVNQLAPDVKKAESNFFAGNTGTWDDLKKTGWLKPEEPALDDKLKAELTRISAAHGAAGTRGGPAYQAEVEDAKDWAAWRQHPVGKLAEGLGGVVPYILTGEMTIPLMVLQGGLERYKQAQAAGKGDLESALLGAAEGAWTAASFKIAGKVLPFRHMLGAEGEKLLTTVARQVGGGALENAAALLLNTIGSNAIAKYGLDDGRALAQGWLQSLVSGGFLGAVFGAMALPLARKFVEYRKDYADLAQRYGYPAETVKELREASKLKDWTIATAEIENEARRRGYTGKQGGPISYQQIDVEAENARVVNTQDALIKRARGGDKDAYAELLKRSMENPEYEVKGKVVDPNQARRGGNNLPAVAGSNGTDATDRTNPAGGGPAAPAATTGGIDLGGGTPPATAGVTPAPQADGLRGLDDVPGGISLAALKAPAGSPEAAAADAVLIDKLNDHIATSGKPLPAAPIQTPPNAASAPAPNTDAGAVQPQGTPGAKRDPLQTKAESGKQKAEIQTAGKPAELENSLTKIERTPSLVLRSSKWLQATQAALNAGFDAELAKGDAADKTLMQRLDTAAGRIETLLKERDVAAMGQNTVAVDRQSVDEHGRSLSDWRSKEILPMLRTWRAGLTEFHAFAKDALKRVRQGGYVKQIETTPEGIESGVATNEDRIIWNAGKIISGDKPSGKTFAQLAELVGRFVGYMEQGRVVRPFTAKQMDGLRFMWSGFVEQSGHGEMLEAKKAEDRRPKAEGKKAEQQPELPKQPETPKAEAVAKAAEAAATHPNNPAPEPTQAQRDAGNYAKGHISISGLEVAIENPAGTRRRPEWPELKDHYGYIKNTQGKDGEHVDAFINPANPESENVFIVNQVDPKSGKFDEHKVMLGYTSPLTARLAYLRNYQKGWKGLGSMVKMTMSEFKEWLKTEDQTKPAEKPAVSVQRSEVSQAPAGLDKKAGLKVAKTETTALTVKGVQSGVAAALEKMAHAALSRATPNGIRRGDAIAINRWLDKIQHDVGARLNIEPGEAYGQWSMIVHGLREMANKIMFEPIRKLGLGRSKSSVLDPDTDINDIAPEITRVMNDWDLAVDFTAMKPTPPSIVVENPSPGADTILAYFPRDILFDDAQKWGKAMGATRVGHDTKALVESNYPDMPIALFKQLQEAMWANKGGEIFYFSGVTADHVRAFFGLEHAVEPSMPEISEQQKKPKQLPPKAPAEKPAAKPDPFEKALSEQEQGRKDFAALTYADYVAKSKADVDFPVYHIKLSEAARALQLLLKKQVLPKAWVESDHGDDAQAVLMAAQDRLAGNLTPWRDAIWEARTGQKPGAAAAPAPAAEPVVVHDAYGKVVHVNDVVRYNPPSRPDESPREAKLRARIDQIKPDGWLHLRVWNPELGTIDEMGRRVSGYLSSKIAVEEKAPAGKPAAGSAPLADAAPSTPRPLTPVTPAASLAQRAAERFAVELQQGPLNKLAAVRIMREVAGGSLAEGKFTDADVSEAIELAVNQLVLKDPRYGKDANVLQAVANIKALKGLIENAPTQSTRTREKDKLQQFSTPAPLAYVLVWAANIQPGDVVLEPSAGVGGIAVMGKAMGGRVIANELSPRRAEILRSSGIADQVLEENAEHLHAILAPKIAAGTLPAPTKVTMNPPFSHGAVSGKNSTMIGGQHLEEALKLLPEGGRLVAIVGEGMGMDKPRFQAWWAKIQRDYNVRANIHVDGNEYRKYGTTFGNQIVVIDKTGPTPDSGVVTGSVAKIEELPVLLKGVRDDLGQLSGVTQPELGAGEPSGGAGAGTPQGAGGGDATAPAATGGGVLSAGGRGGRGGRPSRTGGAAGPASPDTSPGVGRPEELSFRPGGERTDLGGSGGTGAGGGGGVPAGGSTGPRLVITQRGTLDKARGGETPEAAKDVSDIYSEYRPSITSPGALPHPTKLVESTALASVVAPTTTYQPALPESLVRSGTISDAQLEQVVRAGEAHGQMLPSGERAGYMVGDGTGCGKGRTAASIIQDNWTQGRKKAVWLSATGNLINDALRDLTAVVGPFASQRLVNLWENPKALEGRTSGVAFLPYLSLASDFPGIDPNTQKLNPPKIKKGQPVIARMQRLVEWLGPDFDGVIIADESHLCGNAIDIQGGRGVQFASLRGKALVALQSLLPQARVVLMSATGATDVTNLSYADRLGLWGHGTPFANKQQFFNEISSKGMAALEVVARDLKAMGRYLARTLSFQGVETSRLEHKLSPEQIKLYDATAKAWQLVMENVDQTMARTNANLVGMARSRALGSFYGAMQRFYNQTLTALSMPTVLDDMEKQLAAGRSCVVQLVNTNEATQERALGELADEEEPEDMQRALEELDLSPKRILLEHVETNYPTALFEVILAPDGTRSVRQVMDADGKPVEDPEAIRAKRALLLELQSLPAPENPLEQILKTFGADNVAEITGRGKRTVQRPDENGQLRTVVETGRDVAMRNVEAGEFQEGKRKVLVFTAAGGTGFSYHDSKAQEVSSRRVHYVLQAGWRADTAVQGAGRTHRTNQHTAPVYKPASTDLSGQRRFTSAIARRLQELGSLVSGERNASGSGDMYTELDNLENPYSGPAIQALFRDSFGGSRMGGLSSELGGLTFAQLSKVLGFTKTLLNPTTGELETVNTLIDAKTGALNVSKIPSVGKFLNRIMATPVAVQNRLFDEFFGRMSRLVEHAKQAGAFDAGMQTVRALLVKVVNDQVVYQHPTMPMQTRMVDVDLELPRDRKEWAQVQDAKSYVANKKSGRIYALEPGTTRTDRSGTVENTLRKTGTHGVEYVPEHEVQAGDSDYQHFKKVTKAQAERTWRKELAEMPPTKTVRETYLTGALLPIWDRLKLPYLEFYRVMVDRGTPFLGAYVKPKDVDQLRARLGAAGSGVALTPASAFERVLIHGQALELANGWTIKRSRVGGERRIEVEGPRNLAEAEEFEKYIGGHSERINFAERFFIPTEEKAGIAALGKLLAKAPVVESATASGVKPGQVRETSPEWGGQGGGQRTEDRGQTEKSAEPFYSAVLRTVEQAKQGKAPGPQWLSWLKNQPGIKPEELDWLGLEDFLRPQLKQVTREQLADFIRANQVDVREVVKGATDNREGYWTQTNTERGEIVAYDNQTGKEIASEATEYDLTNSLAKLGYFQEITEPDAKFEKWQLPGGQNYRELLLTLPKVEGQRNADGFETESFSEFMRRTGTTAEQAQPRYMAERLKRGTDRKASEDFHSGHFPEPNILAHVRFNERTDAEGRRTLFIEEVQSDWHQKGREQGYAGNDLPAGWSVKEAPELAKRVGNLWAVYNAEGALVSQAPTKAQAQQNAIEGMGVVPDAPFKTTWPLLAMKRMIRYAAENGFDQIAWTTGAQQAERYDLSKQIDGIVVHKISYPAESAGWHYNAFREGSVGDEGMRDDVVRGVAKTDQELAAAIGKDAAKKAIATITQQIAAPAGIDQPEEFELRGADLAVGGEGMKGFYDSILPAEVNKYVKRFGGRVGEARIDVDEPKHVIRHFNTEEQADTWAATNLKGHEYALVPMGTGGFTIFDHTTSQPVRETIRTQDAVHALEITPAMREQALRGQALFEKPGVWHTPDLPAVQAFLAAKGVPEHGAHPVDNGPASLGATPGRLVDSAAEQFAEELRQIAEASPEPYHFTPEGQAVLYGTSNIEHRTSNIEGAGGAVREGAHLQEAGLRVAYLQALKARAQQRILQGQGSATDAARAFAGGRTVSTVLKDYVESAGAKIATLRGLKLTTPQDTAAALRILRSPLVETLKVLALNAQHRVLSARVVTVGLLDASLAAPREVLADLPPGTKRIILAHNHPSGDPGASAEDIRLTRELVAAAKILGVDVADHVITDGEKYVSLREAGLVEFGGDAGAGAGIPGAAQRLPPQAETPLQPGAVQQPWEVLRRDSLLRLRTREDLARFAAALRQSAPDSGHIIYLTVKFGVTAVTRFALSDGPAEIARIVAREAGWHGAAAWLVDLPQDGTSAAFKETVQRLIAAGKTLGLPVLDVVGQKPTGAPGSAAADYSAREQGVAEFKEGRGAWGEGGGEEEAEGRGLKGEGKGNGPDVSAKPVSEPPANAREQAPSPSQDSVRFNPRPGQTGPGATGGSEADRQNAVNGKNAVTPEQDRAYLDAVARGDEAAAQRMVDEAAKRAGLAAPEPKNKEALKIWRWARSHGLYLPAGRNRISNITGWTLKRSLEETRLIFLPHLDRWVLNVGQPELRERNLKSFDDDAVEYLENSSVPHVRALLLSPIYGPRHIRLATHFTGDPDLDEASAASARAISGLETGRSDRRKDAGIEFGYALRAVSFLKMRGLSLGARIEGARAILASLVQAEDDSVNEVYKGKYFADNTDLLSSTPSDEWGHPYPENEETLRSLVNYPRAVNAAEVFAGEILTHDVGLSESYWLNNIAREAGLPPPDEADSNWWVITHLALSDVLERFNDPGYALELATKAARISLEKIAINSELDDRNRRFSALFGNEQATAPTESRLEIAPLERTGTLNLGMNALNAEAAATIHSILDSTEGSGFPAFKSPDVILRDSAGRVLSLSERFNPQESGGGGGQGQMVREERAEWGKANRPEADGARLRNEATPGRGVDAAETPAQAYERAIAEKAEGRGLKAEGGGAEPPTPPPPVATGAGAEDPDNPYLKQIEALNKLVAQKDKDLAAATKSWKSAFSEGFKAKLNARKRAKPDFDNAMEEMHGAMEKVGELATAETPEERAALGRQAVAQAARSGRQAERRGAAGKLAEITGTPAPAADEALPTAASTVRAAYNQARSEGFLRGAAANSPFHAFVEGALDKHFKQMAKRTAPARLALMESDLDRIEAARQAARADPDNGRAILRGLLMGNLTQRGLFNEQDADRMLNAKGYTHDDLLAAVRSVLSDRVTDFYVADIQKLLGKEDARPWNIAVALKPEYDALMETMGPIWNGLQVLYAAEDRLKHLREQGAAPETIERQNERIDGLREAFGAALEDPKLLKRFALGLKVDNPAYATALEKHQSVENIPTKISLAQGFPNSTAAQIVRALHDEVADVIARSDQEKFVTVAGVKQNVADVSRALASGLAAKPEVYAADDRGNVRPSLLHHPLRTLADVGRWVRKLNTSQRSRALLIGGGQDDSLAEKLFWDAPRQGESDAQLMEMNALEARDAKLKALGLKPTDLLRWSADSHDAQILGQTIPLTTQEKMFWWAALQRPAYVDALSRSAIKRETFRGKDQVPKLRLGEQGVPVFRAYLAAQLSPAQKALAEWYQQKLTSYGEGANRVTEHFRGVWKYTEEKYWPLMVDGSQTMAAQKEGADALDTMRSNTQRLTDNAGHGQRLVKHKNDLLYDNIDKVFEAKTHEMAIYNHMTIPTLAAEKMLRYRAREDHPEGPVNLRETIAAHFGEPYWKETRDALARAAGEMNNESTWGNVQKYFLRPLQKNVSRFTFWGNILAVLHHRVGVGLNYVGSMSDLDPLLALKYVGGSLWNLPSEAFWLSAANRRARALLYQHSGYFKARIQHHATQVFQNLPNDRRTTAIEGHFKLARYYGQKVETAGMSRLAQADLRDAVRAFVTLEGQRITPAELDAMARRKFYADSFDGLTDAQKQDARDAVTADRVEVMHRANAIPSSALDETAQHAWLSAGKMGWLWPWSGPSTVSANLFQRSVVKALYAKRGERLRQTRGMVKWAFLLALGSVFLHELTSWLFKSAKHGELQTGDKEAEQTARNLAYRTMDTFLPITGRLAEYATLFGSPGHDPRDTSLITRLMTDAVRGTYNIHAANEASWDDEKFRKGFGQLVLAGAMGLGFPAKGPLDAVEAAAGLAGHPLVNEAARKNQLDMSAQYGRQQVRADMEQAMQEARANRPERTNRPERPSRP